MGVNGLATQGARQQQPWYLLHFKDELTLVSLSRYQQLVEHYTFLSEQNMLW